MGVSATFGDGWTYYTADQLQEIPAAIEEMITDTELGDSIEAGGGLASITTMMCENVTELITVNVVYQKLSLSERLMYATMDSEKLADLLLGQKDSLIEAYKAMGMEVSAMEAVEVTYLGQTRSALRTAATIPTAPRKSWICSPLCPESPTPNMSRTSKNMPDFTAVVRSGVF